MKNNNQEINKEIQLGLKKYITGFVLSIVLTVISYFVATSLELGKFTMLTVLSVLACTQAGVQLIYFMHIKEEEKPRFILLNFLFFVIVVAIITIGTIFVMYAMTRNH